LSGAVSLHGEGGWAIIWQGKFALSLGVGMRKMGWCREVAAMMSRSWALYAQKLSCARKCSQV